MQITQVLSGVAVSDLDAAARWYAALFGRTADRAPMPNLVEWLLPDGGVVQLVADPGRAGGSLLSFQVADARAALAAWAERGGPAVALDDTSSDMVLFASAPDPDGNLVSIVEVRSGVDL